MRYSTVHFCSEDLTATTGANTIFFVLIWQRQPSPIIVLLSSYDSENPGTVQSTVQYNTVQFCLLDLPATTWSTNILFSEFDSDNPGIL